MKPTLLMSPQKKPTLLIPWSQTSTLQGCEEIHFCCICHPVCGSLLCSPSNLVLRVLGFYNHSIHRRKPFYLLPCSLCLATLASSLFLAYALPTAWNTLSQIDFLLLPLLPSSLVPALTSQQGLLWPHYSNYNSTTSYPPSILFILLYCLIVLYSAYHLQTSYIIYLSNWLISPLECKFHEGREFVYFIHWCMPSTGAVLSMYWVVDTQEISVEWMYK